MNWHISDTAEWWQDNTNGNHLLEIPIATVDKSPIPFILKRLFAPSALKLNLGPKRGSYIALHSKPEGKFKSYYNYVKGYNAISTDAYSAEHLYSQTKRLYKKINVTIK